MKQINEDFFDDLDVETISDNSVNNEYDDNNLIISYDDVSDTDIEKRYSLSFIYSVYNIRKVRVPIVDRFR